MAGCKCIVVFQYNGKWFSYPVEMVLDGIMELARLSWNARQSFGERCENVARAVRKYRHCPKCGKKVVFV